MMRVLELSEILKKKICFVCCDVCSNNTQVNRQAARNRAQTNPDSKVIVLIVGVCEADVVDFEYFS
jgi:hypothetical protein